MTAGRGHARQWWVIAASGAAFAVEFVVDKVPLVDSTWDAIHTLIRPVVGGMAGAAIPDCLRPSDEKEVLTGLLAAPLIAQRALQGKCK